METYTDTHDSLSERLITVNTTIPEEESHTLQKTTKTSKYKDYQKKWRDEHPDYMRKYRDTKLKGVKQCEVCNGIYNKSYLYRHQKKCKLPEDVTKANSAYASI